MGFTAAFGYWVACCLAQVALLVLIKAALGQFFPAFGDGTTLVAIAAASAMVWGVNFLILRGVKQEMALNTIGTIAKLVPIAIFVVFVIAGFNADIFAPNLWGREETSFTSVASQVRNTILVTVFVFVGMEGASVYSRYAKDRNDAGFATILGFLGLLFLDVARCGRRAGLPQGVVICGSQESERRHQGAGRYAGDDLENRALARLRRAIQESRPEGAVRASSVQTRPA
jgi:amino acid transporter